MQGANHKKRTITIILFGSIFLFIALLCSIFTVQRLFILTDSHYPHVQNLDGSASFPAFESSWRNQKWIIRRVQFFSTDHSRQMVAHWHQQEGWQSVTEVGQRWELDAFKSGLDVHHSAIIYNDYWEEVCQVELTCIFVRTTITVELPNLRLFAQ